MFAGGFSELRPVFPISFRSFAVLLQRWLELGFAPQPCRQALERFIEEEGLSPALFSPEEIERGGVAATRALLFGDAVVEHEWLWSFHSPAGEFSCAVSPEGVPSIASILRRAAELPGAQELEEALDPDTPPEILSALAGAYRTETPHGTWPVPRAPGIYRREHASLVIRSGTTSVLVDPQGLSSGWTTNNGRYPAERDHVPFDAIAITHTHEDHWSLASVLAAAREDDPLVIVPRVRTINLLAPEDLQASLALAGLRACAPEWGTRVRVGDIEIDVLPFYGEQPTREAPGCERDVRNWGNCYRFNCPEFSALILVDSGVDPMGSALEAIAASVAERGPVDVLLSCCQAFPEAINPGLPMYAMTLPFARLEQIHRARLAGKIEAMTLGPAGVVDACRAARARFFLPYAHGFRGLGTDPTSTEGGGLSESSVREQVARGVKKEGIRTEVLDWHPGDVARFSGERLVVASE